MKEHEIQRAASPYGFWADDIGNGSGRDGKRVWVLSHLDKLHCFVRGTLQEALHTTKDLSGSGQGT